MSKILYYYQILNVSPANTIEEIRSVYRQLAKQYHPDLNPAINAAEQFRLITEAYDYLRIHHVQKKTTAKIYRRIDPVFNVIDKVFAVTVQLPYDSSDVDLTVFLMWDTTEAQIAFSKGQKYPCTVNFHWYGRALRILFINVL